MFLASLDRLVGAAHSGFPVCAGPLLKQDGFETMDCVAAVPPTRPQGLDPFVECAMTVPDSMGDDDGIPPHHGLRREPRGIADFPTAGSWASWKCGGPENEKGRYTLVFLAAPDDVERSRDTKTPLLELTYNWDEREYQGGRNFGHLYRVDDIYETCRKRWMRASRSTARHATATWHSSARPTTSRSSSFSGETRNRRRNPGPQCRIRACGDQANHTVLYLYQPVSIVGESSRKP